MQSLLRFADTWDPSLTPKREFTKFHIYLYKCPVNDGRSFSVGHGIRPNTKLSYNRTPFTSNLRSLCLTTHCQQRSKTHTAFENRWRTIGMVGSQIVLVVHTWPELNKEKGEEIGRIISARKATRLEREAYEEGLY